MRLVMIAAMIFVSTAAVAGGGIPTTPPVPEVVPQVFHDAAGRTVGAGGLGLSCSEQPKDPDPEVVEHCQPFKWVGVVTNIYRNSIGEAESITLRVVSGGDPHATTNLAIVGIGDDQVDDDPKVDLALSRWLKPGLKIEASGTLKGITGMALANRIVAVPLVGK